VAPLAEGEKLRFNFRGVPLDTVLDYLSKAAGFVIFRRNVNLNGRVDVVSHQPLNRDEAVALLNTVLNDKGYTAVRKDRILTILSRSEASKFSQLPVFIGSDPKTIPNNDVMVTQILPVRYADATQLINDLLPLMETYTIASANQSSNAILLTDTQANIRRMAEIIQALDTSISRISVLKVFVLQYADATETAKLINDLFRNMGTTSGASRDPRAQFFAMMGGPGGRGGRGGGDMGGGGGGASEARKAATSLTAVADTRMNAVVVSGPDELLPTIEQLVSEIDKSAQELKEIQVFTLKYADATEMTQVVNDVFQGKTSSSQTQGGRGGRAQFMQRFMGMNQPQGGTGEGRKAEENTVLAVADIRTNSVVVSASHDMMLQISGMVTALDMNPAKDQRVHVYPIKNADGAKMETMLQGMFPGTTSGSRTSTSRTNTSTSRTGTSGNTRRTGSQSGSGGDFTLGGSSSGSSSGR
jgi:general secretion pathway protein D